MGVKNLQEIRVELKSRFDSHRNNPSHGPSKYALGLARVVDVNYEEHLATLRILTGQQEEYQQVKNKVKVTGPLT